MGQRNQPYQGGGNRPGGGNPQGGRDQRGAEPRFQVPAQDTKKIIVDGDVELLVRWADKIGEALADQRLSTNQIRNVYGTARQIQFRWDKPGSANEAQAFRDAVLLRPKLAYYAEREKQTKGGSTIGMETLQRVLEPALELIGESGNPIHERYQRFVEYFEAIVAYHKKHGGR
ncbi:MAG: type III-A CRISPR-associated protein Csm2 [Anaerolineae bacterium]|nr:type III-A CRISPR-associated protein Csm2 [Anaerolineae bacterium]